MIFPSLSVYVVIVMSPICCVETVKFSARQTVAIMAQTMANVESVVFMSSSISQSTRATGNRWRVRPDLRRTSGLSAHAVPDVRRNIERRNRAPDLAARLSGLSPVKGVNLSARPAHADNSTRANVRPVPRSVRPDLRQLRNRSPCAVHVRGLFAACGVRACPSGTLSGPTCAVSCVACRASCALPDVGAAVRPDLAAVRPVTVKGVNLSACRAVLPDVRQPCA